MVIPGVVLAVGLFIAYTRPPFLLYGTLWILFLAYLTKELPVGYSQSDATFRGIHPELEDAGRILGAGRLTVLREITAPLARSGIIAAWCFVFIGVIRELSAATCSGHARPPADRGKAAVPGVAIKGLFKRYGDVAAVDGLDLEVKPGELVALLGPSGLRQDHHAQGGRGLSQAGGR